MNDTLRHRLSALIAEMTVATRILKEHGIDPNQKEDREAGEVLKRIVEKAYLAK